MRAKLFLSDHFIIDAFLSSCSMCTQVINNINCTLQLTTNLVKRSQRHCRSFRDLTLLDLPLVKPNVVRLHLSTRLRVPGTNCQERYVS